mmetsp:Transcript_1710/g.3648  ORF Transcript_1710/g.3648 Transcript_1710/m.3648 type:complete len:731 (+) Transcript_1710:51-2243(+)
MAAHTDFSCHDVKQGISVPVEVQPSMGGKRNCREASATTESTAMLGRSLSCFNGPAAAASPMSKKKKLHHPGMPLAYSESAEVVNDPVRLPSPTGVCADPSAIGGWGSQSKIQAAQMPSKFSQIKTLPPTLKGITDAARILRASKTSPAGAGKENDQEDGKQNSQDNVTVPPLLLSFPTESVYMLACCVKTASSRSIRKLLSRTESQSSMSSACSHKGYMDFILQAPSVHQGSSSLKESIHPKNDSLDWMIKCNDNSFSDPADRMAPLLFVLDGHHALNFCHFSKPKTFVIRPPALAANSTNSANDATTPVAPFAPMLNTSLKSGSLKENSFSPLPVFDNGSKPTIGSITNTTAQIAHHDPKLCAANFSESREVFLRLASKFWPGPVVFHIQVRMLGGEDVPHISKKLSSSSMPSLRSLSSTGDLTAPGNLNPATDAAGIPVLPASVLIPASRLVANQDGQERERHFVGMRCPSHPLSRKILNEIYHGPSRSNISSFSHSQSSDSLASISSIDENIGGESKFTEQKSSSSKTGRARSSIAVMGCMVPEPKSSVDNSAKPASAKPSSAYMTSSTGATTAADVDEAMVAMMQSTSSTDGHEKNKGQLFIVNGEDNRESFSVPPCQFGRAHPVSLVIDGDNRTIHMMRHCDGPVAKEPAGRTIKDTLLTKNSIYHALRKPLPPSNNGQSFNRSTSHEGAIKEKKGDSASIDRVIAAVLSRWKIQESTYQTISS